MLQLPLNALTGGGGLGKLKADPALLAGVEEMRQLALKAMDQTVRTGQAGLDILRDLQAKGQMPRVLNSLAAAGPIGKAMKAFVKLGLSLINNPNNLAAAREFGEYAREALEGLSVHQALNPLPPNLGLAAAPVVAAAPVIATAPVATVAKTY